MASGIFELSVPEETPLGAKNPVADFWTEPWPYWDMKERAGPLFDILSGSGLVIFKVRFSCRSTLNILTDECVGRPQVSLLFLSQLLKINQRVNVSTVIASEF